jgi:glutamate-1-semialdehyde 2,1-aminomutase
VRSPNGSARGVSQILEGHALPWHVTRVGARVEYCSALSHPGPAARPDARCPLLEAYIHLYLLNRGVLLTPFHNMALMCPFTSADVLIHNRLLDECLALSCEAFRAGLPSPTPCRTIVRAQGRPG